MCRCTLYQERQRGSDFLAIVRLKPEHSILQIVVWNIPVNVGVIWARFVKRNLHFVLPPAANGSSRRSCLASLKAETYTLAGAQFGVSNYLVSTQCSGIRLSYVC